MCSKREKINERTKKLISKDEKRNISFDAHAWVVDETTNEVVFDPDFKEYQEIRKKYGLTDERCYKPISKHHSKIIWNYVRFNSIYPYMRINKNSLTIVEGVENKEQLQFLKQNHCDVYQGYYFSRPIAAKHVMTLLEQNLSVS